MVKIIKLDELEIGDQFQLSASWHEGEVLSKTNTRVRVKYTNYKFLDRGMEEQIAPSFVIEISPSTSVIKVKK